MLSVISQSSRLSLSLHGCSSSPVISLHHPPLKLPHPQGFYNSLSQFPMFPISSSCCFTHKNRLWLTLVNGFLFYLRQFSSNLFQYFCSYFFFPYPYNSFAIYFPSNSLLNTFFSSFISYRYVSSSSSLPYSFSSSFTRSLVFLRFSLLSQVSSSAVHPFHHTRYLSLPHTCLLFIIFSTSHFFSPSITTGCGISFLCPSTCPVYLHTLLTLTTGCIFTVLGSSNSNAFIETIDLTL